jgi:MFS superfamily sulfate permease-like transporter
VFGKQKELFTRLSENQALRALFIACFDSRVAPTLLTQTDPEELFILSNVGNYGSMQGGSTATIEYVLAVGVVCDGLQFLMGLSKMDKLTNMFPSNVVHGMLAGIGIIIMSKQIHSLLGVSFSGKMIPTIMAIPASFANMVPSVALIGGLSFGIMIA